ncbi:MAG: hypothetical protein PVF70_04555 [Anaerolineales bacterium]|jgi:hypothetical protein
MGTEIALRKPLHIVITKARWGKEIKMNPSRKVASWSIMLVTILALVSCAPAAADREIVITFDGQECRYEGPSVVNEGDRIITLNNIAEHDVDLTVVRIDEGKTWQDVLENLDAFTIGTPPTWTTFVRTELISDNPAARKYTLTEGIYAIICWSTSPLGGWPAASLEVKGE